MSHLRDKCRHRAGWENAPVQAFCRALRPHSSRRSAGLYSVLSSYGVLPYSATSRITVFRTACGRVAPVRREEMDVRSGRVTSIHAWRMRRLRSEISSSGKVEIWVGSCRWGVVCLAAAVLTHEAHRSLPASLLIFGCHDRGIDGEMRL